MKAFITKIFITSLVLLYFYLNSSYSQVGAEFPIEVRPDSCFALGFSEDNTKYMIVMRREKSSGADIVVQFHSKADHSLIGSPIVLGSTNIPAEGFDLGIPQVSFDGTRFLVVWTDGQNGGIKYRFIHSQTFELSQLYNDPTLPVFLGGIKTLHYNLATNRYLLISSIKSQDGYYHIYNFIGIDGSISSSNPLTNILSRKELSVSYAAGKFLICFVPVSSFASDYEVMGQLLSENGTLIGSPFTIDGSTYPSDDPLFVFFDGNYHNCFFPEEEPTGWKIYARRIDQSGNVEQNRILVSNDGHILPFAILGFGKILVTWSRFPFMNAPGIIKGRFFDLNLNPLGPSDFVIFMPKDDKFPVGSMGSYDPSINLYYVYTTRATLSVTPDSAFIFVNGDIYGVPVMAPTEVEDERLASNDFELYQNFPNPFNSSTQIKFSVKENQFVTIKLLDVLGEETAILLNQEKSKGAHTINFDAAQYNLSSGVYFYKMTAGNFVSVRKMVYLK